MEAILLSIREYSVIRQDHLLLSPLLVLLSEEWIETQDML